MDLLQVKIFVYAAKCASFSQVANHLYISQSSVSKYISALESELGYTLFTRNGKTIALTQFGKNLLPYAENMLAAENETMDFVRAQRAGENLLSIGIPDDLKDSSNIGFFRAYFNAIHQLYASNPHISIRTAFYPSQEMFGLLSRKKLSAICVPILDEKNFDDEFPVSGAYRRISHIQHYFALGSGLTGCNSLDEIKELVKTIYYIQSEVPRKILDQLIHQFSMHPDIVVCSSPMELLVHIVNDEPYSVSLIESHLVPIFRDLDIMLYPLNKDGIASSFYLIWEKDFEIPVIRQLGDLLYQFLQSERQFLNHSPTIYSSYLQPEEDAL